MKPWPALVVTVWLLQVAGLRAQAPGEGARWTDFAVASRLDEFLGEPFFQPMQQLWEKRGGWGGVLTAKNGTVVAFQSPGGGNCRRSRDGGKTWEPVDFGNAVNKIRLLRGKDSVTGYAIGVEIHKLVLPSSAPHATPPSAPQP